MLEYETRLRELGLRVTKQRRAVIEALSIQPHQGVAEIADRARKQLGRVSTQSIYDTVHALTNVGVLRSFEPPGSPEIYELARGDNHHHVICRRCGSITDVSCHIGSAPCLTPSNDAGYRVTEAEVTYWGLCPACQKSGSDHLPTLES